MTFCLRLKYITLLNPFLTLSIILLSASVLTSKAKARKTQPSPDIMQIAILAVVTLLMGSVSSAALPTPNTNLVPR